MAIEKHRELFKNMENDLEFQVESTKIWLLEEILAVMKTNGISRSELGRRLGTSRAYITKLFRANINLTLKSIIQIVNALDAKISIRIYPKEATMRWFEIYEQKYTQPKSFGDYNPSEYKKEEKLSITMKEPSDEYCSTAA